MIIKIVWNIKFDRFSENDAATEAKDILAKYQNIPAENKPDKINILVIGIGSAVISHLAKNNLPIEAIESWS